ncbi:ATP-dependent Clp protease ATP-binding subunit [Candidatus Gracilibacteria bacterium]|nr:ATP-dependent Clp protease ATP-binding subunit [Candidatus Gracilibacteria bacterium]
MVYNNFSDGYKKTLINAENKAREIGLKNLQPEDIFLELLETADGGILEILTLYGIDKKLTLEIINKGLFNVAPLKRKGVYSGMHQKCKDIILGSVKIAAQNTKARASLEDLLLSLLINDIWLANFLEYIGINPSDVETNMNDLIKVGTIDGLNGQILDEDTSDSSIEKLFGNLADNIFSSLQGGKDESEGDLPFDANPVMEDKKDESSTPALDFFSTDLTAEARDGKIDVIIGRETEIERLIAILNRKTKNNPCLVGDAGVGKTAIVEGLALKIAKGEVPFSMKDKRILSLDMSSLVAGTKFRGEFETRIKQVIDEASKAENEVLLFIDEIHTIIGAGSGEGSLDASNILKPAMGRGKIRVIGATTLGEYQKYIEKDPALERRFQKINASEPDRKTATEIIIGLKEVYEEYHNLNISNEAITEAVDLSMRYITDRQLPDKAIDLVDEACSLKSMKYNFDEAEIKKIKEKIAKNQKKIEDSVISQQYKRAVTLKETQKKLEKEIQSLKKKFSIPKDKRFWVTPEDIHRVLSITTGIPIANLSKNEIDRLKKLPGIMKKSIISQDDAIDAISKSIIRNKTGIGEPHRPLGSFLFLGPTGVGKTEIVKVLAREYYGDEEALIKIDMSEYSDKTATNKLIGASAGYVGYEEGGLLTEKVRKKPYSIILFDEIEKGDVEVYNLLLQILEEGILTDNKGRKINFKNTIIIMTSNIGQEEFSEKAAQIGFNISETAEEKIITDYEKAKQKIKDSLTDYFSPEFINRIDKVIVFNPLDTAAIKKIVKLLLSKFNTRLEMKGLKLNFDAKAITTITKEVYNPEFGAREIRRYITDTIEDSIAESILQNPEKKSFTLKSIKNKIEVQ